jgi:protein-S-isoprenylcysteine O-methyltransferase Ste14
MALRDELARSGALLFRWRSYLPLVFAPLLFHALNDFAELSPDDSLGERWQWFCVFVAFAGLLLRALVVGQAPPRTSGRNTLEQVADSLNTTGMYSVVRHPLYLGNFLGFLGVALFPQNLLLVVAAVLAFALYYERIMLAEEKFLREKFRAEFDRWADRTPAFFPNPSLWKKSAYPFSWQLAAEREYSGLFAIVVTFTVLDVARGWFERGWVRLEPEWAVFLATGTVVWALLRAGKKRSRRRSAVASRL